MKKEMIYNIINGFCDEDTLSMVKNAEITDAFADGTECGELANEIYEAKLSICKRLNVEEDEELEIIINNMERIMKIIALKMYDYGKTESTDKDK